MGKKSAPAPPDYRAAATETAAGNLENLRYQTVANRPKQITPFGVSNWWENAPNDWTQRITLNPELQSALTAQQRAQQSRSELGADMTNRLRGVVGQPMDWSGLRDPGVYNVNARRVRNRAEDAIYRRHRDRLNPQWSQREDDMRARLAGMGLAEGSAPYDRAMANFERARNDAFQNARRSAIVGGGQEADRLYRIGRSNADYQNELRARQIAERMMIRGQPLNEINAVLSGQQVNMPQMPGFAQQGYAAGPDMLGAAQQGYLGDLQSFSTQQQQANNLFGGMASLFGGGLFGI